MCDGRLALVVEVACQGDFKQAMEGATLLEQVETVQDSSWPLDVLLVLTLRRRNPGWHQASPTACLNWQAPWSPWTTNSHAS